MREGAKHTRRISTASPGRRCEIVSCPPPPILQLSSLHGSFAFSAEMCVPLLLLCCDFNKRKASPLFSFAVYASSPHDFYPHEGYVEGWLYQRGGNCSLFP